MGNPDKCCFGTGSDDEDESESDEDGGSDTEDEVVIDTYKSNGELVGTAYERQRPELV